MLIRSSHTQGTEILNLEHGTVYKYLQEHCADLSKSCDKSPNPRKGRKA